jgi:hypothetical protein
MGGKYKTSLAGWDADIIFFSSQWDNNLILWEAINSFSCTPVAQLTKILAKEK